MALILLELLVLFVSACRAQMTPSDRPNFIFIFTDDMGFGDLPLAYGHPYAETPHLNRLQKEGTSFKEFSATGNVCPNSRAGIMTSRNPSWYPNYTKEYGFLGTKTITELMKDAGYVTGHIGKWHIGPEPDNDDTEFPEYGITDMRLTGSIKGDPRGREGQRFDETLDFLEDHQNEPFYLNLWVWSPHSTVDPPQQFIDHFQDLKVDRDLFGYHMQAKFDEIEDLYGDEGGIDVSMRIWLAEILALDIQVGRLLDKLDELKLAENTVVVFSSDNGPDTADTGLPYIGYSGGLRGEKSTFYEGGFRVPFIVRWPNKVPAGRVDETSIMFGLDWLPTVCSLAGAEVPWDLIEGEDVSDVWMGNSRSRKNPLFYRRLKQHGHDKVYMRYGKWKLHKEEEELYDLEIDPTERVNIYEKKPDVVSALLKSMEAWEATLPTDHNRLPDDPAPFDPMAPVEAVLLPDLPDAFPSPVAPNVPAPLEPTPAPVETNPVEGAPTPKAPTSSASNSIKCSEFLWFSAIIGLTLLY